MHALVFWNKHIWLANFKRAISCNFHSSRSTTTFKEFKNTLDLSLKVWQSWWHHVNNMRPWMKSIPRDKFPSNTQTRIFSGCMSAWMKLSTRKYNYFLRYIEHTTNYINNRCTKDNFVKTQDTAKENENQILPKPS